MNIRDIGSKSVCQGAVGCIQTGGFSTQFYFTAWRAYRVSGKREFNRQAFHKTVPNADTYDAQLTALR